MMQTKNKICPKCLEVELTDAEQARKHPRCYWCEVEATKIFNKAMEGLQPPKPIPSPLEFGRPERITGTKRPSEKSAPSDIEDNRLYNDLDDVGREAVLDGRHPKEDKMGYEAPTSGMDFSEDAKEFLLENFGMDANKSTKYTIVEAHGEEDTKLTFQISARVKPEMRDALEKILEIELEQIINFLTFGGKHESIIAKIMKLSSGGHQAM